VGLAWALLLLRFLSMEAPGGHPRLARPLLSSPAARAAALPLAPARQQQGARHLAELPEVLLCDLDGTLIDTMPILADLATDVLAEIYGMPRHLGRDMYLATSGLPFIQQLDIICPGDPRNRDASARFEGRKPARCASARMTPETRRALADLQRRGVEIVVSSNNGVANVNAFVEASEFPFDLVLAYDPTPGQALAKGRPHIERAAETFGVTRSEMLFVGDSLHDGEIAAREGLPFIGVTGTFSRERFALRFPGAPVVAIVDRVAEIPALLPA
jgi:phosphoglycolate phosphatase-like HAD superfamily hydrolase